jgi:hypothetical protein
MPHLVPQVPHRLQRPALGLVGRLHLAGGILDEGQDQLDPARQLRLGLQPLGQAQQFPPAVAGLATGSPWAPPVLGLPMVLYTSGGHLFSPHDPPRSPGGPETESHF